MLKIVPDPPYLPITFAHALILPARDAPCSDVAHQRSAAMLLR